eukprot:scaffold2171_cov253-Pinguiococcus_pyrenoidosus.AAC.9
MALIARFERAEEPKAAESANVPEQKAREVDVEDGPEETQSCTICTDMATSAQTAMRKVRSAQSEKPKCSQTRMATCDAQVSFTRCSPWTKSYSVSCLKALESRCAQRWPFRSARGGARALLHRVTRLASPLFARVKRRESTQDWLRRLGRGVEACFEE